MIYLFYGTDSEKVRTKAFEWVAKARAKEPNLVYARISREELTDNALEDAALSGGLFVKRLLILIDDPFSNMRDFVNPSSDDGFTKSEHSVLDDHLDALATSDNAIIILAPKLASAKAKKIVAKAKVEYKYDKPFAREDARGFNSNLVNALAAKDCGKLWLEINRALRAGDAPEMLHGLLHWKARDIMEKGSRTWKPQESRQLSLALIALLQDSRRGSLDLSLSLEKFALSI
ncbi:MAG: hypothetical protein NTU85_00215 [Candidatus Kaiserbacteria bacterium]|nr:hypothetical protein [Candidatus Kaiserbacteria bacterium]